MAGIGLILRHQLEQGVTGRNTSLERSTLDLREQTAEYEAAPQHEALNDSFETVDASPDSVIQGHKHDEFSGALLGRYANHSICLHGRDVNSSSSFNHCTCYTLQIITGRSGKSHNQAMFTSFFGKKQTK
ncbi:hypothetical protein E2C01_035488 [Portunus trituberculatus]|uniref:Uncharacterized protein n=1 Tax=Portunus trituberculatus TaxID=210409 RepID=A0A5B7F4B5_PORTR|nr:hypothetical protein [Portunus trituberculatus]